MQCPTDFPLIGSSLPMSLLTLFIDSISTAAGRGWCVRKEGKFCLGQKLTRVECNIKYEEQKDQEYIVE